MTEPSGPTLEERQAAQTMAITDAIAAAQTAVNAVNNDSSAAQVAEAEAAVAAATRAIAAGSDLSEAVRAAHTGTVSALGTQLATAKTARMAAMDAAQQAADKAMMATAMKLHAGIVARNTASGAGERDAEYAGENDVNIQVTIGEGEGNTATLKASKTAVAANHGWTGKMYADAEGGDEYVAHVYSNVGEPKMGAKFNSGTGDGNVGFALTDGAVTINSELNTATRVASSQFDHSAGHKTFKLPDPNPSGATKITISGSYYGVSGTYSCTPSEAANGCRVNKAADGYTLQLDGTGGGTWTFAPTDATARVTSMPDSAYASYGWWLKKSADGKTFTASAFTDNKGTEPTALAIANLRGTATYMGGAAGKYALYSTTGGTNDAGHFTARAMLKATFAEAHKVSGTIDNFVGADGMSRNWKVDLMESGMNDTGMIRADDGEAVTAENPLIKTVWTIDGTKAAAAGQWTGNLQEAGDDGVPKVGKGTFYGTYGNDGKIVGAFGVTKQ